MRTLVIILIGFALLGVGLLLGKWIGSADKIATIRIAQGFLAIWFAVAFINMWIGVSRAGYSVREELPIFLLIYLVPACAAIFVWWKSSR